MTQPVMDYETWLAAQHRQTPAGDQGPDFADVSTRADALEAAGVVSYAVAGLDAAYDAAVALLADTVRVARSYVERAELVRQEAQEDAAAKVIADAALARWQVERAQHDRLGTNGKGVHLKPEPAPKPRRQPEQVLQALAGLHMEAAALLDMAEQQHQAEGVQAAALSARPLWVTHAEERAATAAAAVDVTALLPDLRAQCAAWQAAQGELARISGDRAYRGDTAALLETFPGLLTVAASPAIAWLRELHTFAVQHEAEMVHEARRQAAKQTSIAYAYWLKDHGREVRGVLLPGGVELFPGDYDFARATMNASEIASAGGWAAVEAQCDRDTASQRAHMAMPPAIPLRVEPPTTHMQEHTS